MPVRLFVAIELEADVRRALAAAVAPLRDAAPSVRWVSESRLHLTLKFLGEQTASVGADVAAAVSRLARSHAPFPIGVVGLGAFPNRRFPRVLWAAVAPEPRLELLYHDVELACSALGLALEGRTFRPHVTIGRAARMLPVEIEPLDRAARGARVALTSHVSSVDLMRSELTAGRAQHERLLAAPLGAE